MKLPLTSAIQSAALWNLASGLSVPGQVFLNDGSRRLSHSSAIDLSTARSILAQILGLSQFYTLNSSNKQAIEQVDKFESSSLEIFGESQHNGGSALIIIEGFSNPEVAQFSHLHQFSIADPPSSKANFGLLTSFNEQATVLRQTQSQIYSNFGSSLFRELKSLAGVYDFETSVLGNIALLHVNTLQSIAPQPEKGSRDHSFALESIIKGVEQAYAYADDHDIKLVAIFMPSKPNKGRDWPEEQDKEASKPAVRVLHQRSLSDDTSFMVDHANGKLLSRVEESAFRGILPSCFTSLESCEHITRNCTGHGTCAKIYSGSDKERPCFRCACKADVEESAEGTIIKTTRYGGPACQKKDIAVQFWLLAGFAIVMAFLLSWGIGLLYSIGQEELPSVLGAGVPGSKAR